MQTFVELFRRRAKLLLLLLSLPFSTLAQNAPVIHWINDAGENAATLLNSSKHFTTSFKGWNDVQITLVTGAVNSVYTEQFATGSSQNNPAYLTSFVGFATNGTGNLLPGQMKALETVHGPAAMILQFDFAIPLSSQDRILLADADSIEQYTLEAFRHGAEISLSDWPYEYLSGQSSQMPDARWPVWNPVDGSLISQTNVNLNEPLVEVTPRQTVDRVVLSKAPVGVGSLTIQFISVPTLTVQMQRSDANLVLRWPGMFTNTAVYEAAALTTATQWTPVTNPPVLNQGWFYLTNSLTTTNRFFRVQSP